MGSSFIQVLDKPPHYTVGESLVLIWKNAPLLVIFSVLIILIASYLLYMTFKNHKMNVWIGLLFGVTLAIVIGGLCMEATPKRLTYRNIYSATKPTSYVLRSDKKTMKAIKNARDILYYDQDHHILNQFPTTVSDEAKNEAISKSRQVQHINFYGISRNDALMKIAKSQPLKNGIRFSMNKIVAVSEKDGEVTVYYIPN